MDKGQLSELVKKLDDSLTVSEGKQFIEVTIQPSKLHATATRLRDDQNTLFDFLFSQSGVDYKHGLGVVYHLRSTLHGHSIVLKTIVADRLDPHIDTVSDLWKTAEFHEREIFDLFGIKFDNHPDLRRFFLDKTWGYPLRKDYVDEINIVTK